MAPWCDANQDEAFDAYVTYVAAADRETVAAEMLRRYHDVVLPKRTGVDSPPPSRVALTPPWSS